MRINATASARILAMAAALMVAGCDKERCEPVSRAASAPDQLADVRKASETNVRVSASNPDSVRFRGVQVWPQAIRNQFAVCGQANVFGPSSNTYVLFVAVVTRNDADQDPARRFMVDARVGSTVTEATKVYVDTLARCFEGGGPQNPRREMLVPVPPMPDDMKTVLAGPAPAPPPAPVAPVVSVVPIPAAQPQALAPRHPAPTSSPASGTIVMRHPGNIRIAPQGEVLRVEPRGKELRVFGEAPGGWLQIGDAQANGWVHDSMVERR
ncbi:MAG: hypothetical protein ACJ8AI_13130 [Rhodopila sp.]